ncbi:MAG TPA: hypothetical protein VHV82_13790 [Sporichthyaceae bacterium]|nr:hypothetical protein [Sporichthyaceae bacterium]
MTQPTDASRYPEWSEADLDTYRAGTIVTHRGKTYQAKPWPADGWARQPAYEPGGSTPWRYAWDELPAGRQTGAGHRRPSGAHAGPAAPE